MPTRSDHISCAFMVLVGGAIRMKDNSDSLPLLTNPKLPARYRRLPVVDVGANDGRDYTLPPALLGHRVYSFEPTSANYVRQPRNDFEPLRALGILPCPDNVPTSIPGSRRTSSNAASPSTPQM